MGITERSPSSDSPSTHPLRSPPPLLSHTTPSSPLTPSLSTPMSPLCSTTRPSTISAEETSILRDPPTPTSTDSSLRLSPPHCLPQIRWCPQRRCDRVPDQPRPLPPYPFHALLLRSRHLRREGLPRAALRCRDHQLLIRARLHDGQV